jgi:phosphoribosylformimino-5-aminoimidazole carboxamide ribotide isomerase
LNVIPVIDVLNGVVVHAKRGERATYQAIRSQLTHSSEPLDIVAALLDVYPFQQLYIADLTLFKSQTRAMKIIIT